MRRCGKGDQPPEFVDRHLRATGCVASQGINPDQQRVPMKGKRHAGCPEPIREDTSEFAAVDDKLIFGLERSAVFDSLYPIARWIASGSSSSTTLSTRRSNASKR